MHDEVGELAGTLNAMLASLERAREAEHRFVGDASHELRTPLTALRGNAAYIARHGAGTGRAGRHRGRRGAARGELLDDLLALAREDAAAPARGEPLDLAALARAGRRCRRRARPEPASVLGERDALERALAQPGGNARPPRPTGGA